MKRISNRKNNHAQRIITICIIDENYKIYDLIPLYNGYFLDYIWHYALTYDLPHINNKIISFKNHISEISNDESPSLQNILSNKVITKSNESDDSNIQNESSNLHETNEAIDDQIEIDYLKKSYSRFVKSESSISILKEYNNSHINNKPIQIPISGNDSNNVIVRQFRRNNDIPFGKFYNSLKKKDSFYYHYVKPTHKEYYFHVYNKKQSFYNSKSYFIDFLNNSDSISFYDRIKLPLISDDNNPYNIESLYKWNALIRKFVSNSEYTKCIIITPLTVCQSEQIETLSKIYKLKCSYSEPYMILYRTVDTVLIPINKSHHIINGCFITHYKNSFQKAHLNSNRLGFSLLRKLGWNGGGLGVQEQGDKEFIEVKIKLDRTGLGCDLSKMFG